MAKYDKVAAPGALRGAVDVLRGATARRAEIEDEESLDALIANPSRQFLRPYLLPVLRSWC